MTDIFNKAKEGLKSVTSIGTGMVIGNMATMFLGEAIIPIKICAYVGSYILSLMLSEKTDEYIDKKAEEIKNELDEQMKTQKENGEGA